MVLSECVGACSGVRSETDRFRQGPAKSCAKYLARSLEGRLNRRYRIPPVPIRRLFNTHAKPCLDEHINCLAIDLFPRDYLYYAPGHVMDSRSLARRHRLQT